MKKEKGLTVKQKGDSQITLHKKKRFIEYFRETRGHISNCARAVGIARKTYYNWMQKDKEFAVKILEADEELGDDIRSALVTKAGEGDLGAIIFYLKKRHPDFKEQPRMVGVKTNGEQIEVVIKDYE